MSGGRGDSVHWPGSPAKPLGGAPVRPFVCRQRRRRAVEVEAADADHLVGMGMLRGSASRSVAVFVRGDVRGSSA